MLNEAYWAAADGAQGSLAGGWILVLFVLVLLMAFALIIVGAVLLDLDDPAIVLARTTDPIFEPQESYETVGVVDNVVFPCG